VEFDTNNGDIAVGDGGAISLGGVTYAKGLGVHADSDIRFDLSGGGYERFVSDVGIDDTTGGNGNVIFQVFADGTLLANSGPLAGNSVALTIDVDVSGYQELRLVVDGNGSIDFDSANWADARLVTSSGASVGAIAGVTAQVDGRTLHLLPHTSADANLDGRLTLADAVAVVDGWGVHSTSEPFEDWIRSGDFNLDGITDSLDWDLLNQAWSAAYGTTLDLNYFLNPLAGDADFDGDVDGGDFLAWQRSFGTPMPLADRTLGDSDNDTDVDGDDLVVWQNSYGTSPLAVQAAGSADPDLLASPAAISGSEASVSLTGVVQFFESDQDNRDEDETIEEFYFALSDLQRFAAISSDGSSANRRMAADFDEPLVTLAEDQPPELLHSLDEVFADWRLPTP
jgi:hypothetical protein